jgi:beta-glucosidase
MEVGVRGVGEWTLSYGEETHTFVNALLPGDLAEVGFMSPPSWTEVVEAAPGRILVARLMISERISLAGLIVQPVAPADEELIDEATEAARDAELAVVVVGLTAEQETEALDKKTLALPGRQDDLVRAVAGTARRTVVVINAATPILMPWLDGSMRCSGLGCRGRKAAMRSPTYCSASPSRPADWSPLSRPSTATVRPGM